MFLQGKMQGSLPTANYFQGGGGTLQGSSSRPQGGALTLQGGSPTIQGSNVDPHTVVSTGGVGGATAGAGTGAIYDPAAAARAQALAAAQAAANPVLASLGQLDTILGNKNAESQAEYDKMMAAYKEQNAADLAAKNQNVFGNEDKFTSNNHLSRSNAINAASGLRGTLSSLGALGGSGQEVLERLVGLSLNQDAGAAKENFETNAGNINTAWGQAEREQRQRNEDAGATLRNNKQNNENTIQTSRQSMYNQLANIFGADTAEGKSYAGKSAALAPAIARTTKASVAPYAKASSSYTPAALEQYLAGTQDMNVNTSGQSTVPQNSPVFASGRERERLSGVA